MADEEEIVAGLDAPCEAHEDSRVHGQSTGHGARDELGRLLQVSNGGQGQAPVSHGAPEVRGEEVLPRGGAADPVEEGGRHGEGGGRGGGDGGGREGGGGVREAAERDGCSAAELNVQLPRSVLCRRRGASAARPALAGDSPSRFPAIASSPPPTTYHHMAAIFDSSAPYGGGEGYDPYARSASGLHFYAGGPYAQDTYSPTPGPRNVSTPALEGNMSSGYGGGPGAVSGSMSAGGNTGVGSVSGRMGGEMTLWDALTTGGFPDEPGLLEELEINLNHIWDKTLTVLSPFHSYSSTHSRDAHMMDDADLAGPFIFCLLFGTMLLLAGKSQFGYIYGVGVLGDISIYLLLNMMLEDGIDMYRVSSVLGYCLLPLCIPAFVGMFVQLKYVSLSMLAPSHGIILPTRHCEQLPSLRLWALDIRCCLSC